MTKSLGINALVFSQAIGLVTAEIYESEGEYLLFIVGDTLATFLGCSESLHDCIEEIRSLERLADSDQYKREISRLT
jgi:hypothetical protein